ncbi:MAG: hypothetical protein ACR2P8_12110 [Myxococcota bacterium]
MSQPPDPTGTGANEVELDPAQVGYLRQRLESEQNLVAGAAAGFAASLVGAAAWAGMTVATGFQIGFMAIGIGFLVGYAVRTAGRGVTSTFGVVGATLALVGCALGNLLAVTAIVAGNDGVPFFEALGQLDVALARELMVAFFSPMDLLFYGFAVYEGYRLSFRELGASELEGMLSGGGT